MPIQHVRGCNVTCPNGSGQLGGTGENAIGGDRGGWRSRGHLVGHPRETASLISRLSWVATLKSGVSRFLVMANAIPEAVSPHAKLPPTPPTPNTVLESFAAEPRPPIAYPNPQVDGLPKT